MRWFLNLKTGMKLAFGFGLCLALALVLGISAISQMARMDSIAHEIAIAPLPGTAAVASMTDTLKQYRIFEYRFLLYSRQADMDKVEAEMQTASNKLNGILSEYEKTITQPEDHKNFDALKAQWAQYLSRHPQLISLGRKNHATEGAALINGPMLTDFRQVMTSLTNMIEWNKQNGVRLSNEAKALYLSARRQMITLLLAAILLGIVTGWLITRFITSALAQVSGRLETLRDKDMSEINQAMSALAQGDLTVSAKTYAEPLTLTTKDELGCMAKTFNEMLEQAHSFVHSYNEARVTLGSLVRQVAESAESVAAASIQLSASAEQTGQASTQIARTIEEVAGAANQSATASQEMAQASEQQARSATEAAAGMHQLQDAVRQVRIGSQRQQSAVQQADEGMQQAARSVEGVAQSAQKVAATAQHAAEVAQTGGKAVEQTVVSMAQIKAQVEASSEKVKELGLKSQEIGAIVQTIDEIAEQTNLLALNAAIEAARAGEHGKGFAVVADEVRKLAERATGATKEIGSLIGGVRKNVEETIRAMEASSQSVQQGAQRSQEAGGALTQILQAAETVTTEVQAVSETAREMTASVQSVRTSVAAVRQVTEENEGAIQQMAGGAEQVNAAITVVASISQETAAGAEQMSASAQEVSASAQHVSAAVEEQTASIEETNASAQELSGMAGRLQELVRCFTTEEEAETVSASNTRKPQSPYLRAA